MGNLQMLINFYAVGYHPLLEEKKVLMMELPLIESSIFDEFIPPGQHLRISYYKRPSYTHDSLHQPGEAPEGVHLILHDNQYRRQQVTHSLDVTYTRTKHGQD